MFVPLYHLYILIDLLCVYVSVCVCVVYGLCVSLTYAWLVCRIHSPDNASPRQSMKTIEYLSCHDRWVKVSDILLSQDIDHQTHCIWSCYLSPMTSPPVHCSVSPPDEPLCDSDQRERVIASVELMTCNSMWRFSLYIFIISWKWRTVWVSEVATDSSWSYLTTGVLDVWVRNSCLTYLHHIYIDRTQHFRAHIYVIALKKDAHD